MPQWDETHFGEATACATGILPPGRTYQDTVISARRHDRRALEDVIACSYSRCCDAAAGELHSGVLLQLMLAWGDIDFSHALAAVMSRHSGHYPTTTLIQEPVMRRFFPLTAKVLYAR